MISFFNNLSFAISLNDLSSSFEKNDLASIGNLLLLNLLSVGLSYSYIFLKFYRLICFSKIAFDTLPLINPYTWPFSLFRTLAQPYFSIWYKILPGIKWGSTSFDVSQILGLEALTVLMYVFAQLHKIVLKYL